MAFKTHTRLFAVAATITILSAVGAPASTVHKDSKQYSHIGASWKPSSDAHIALPPQLVTKFNAFKAVSKTNHFGGFSFGGGHHGPTFPVFGGGWKFDHHKGWNKPPEVAAVPVPAALPLLGSGIMALFGMVAMRRRRARTA